VLSGACFRDDPRFAHAKGEQGLADGVVDFVGTSVVQVLTLEPNPRTPSQVAEPLRMVQRTWSANEGFQ
jgi:hypothetical protein